MVKVKLFANFREVAGERQINISASDIEELIEQLIVKYPAMEELIAAKDYLHVTVNGEIIDRGNYKTRELKNDDVIAVFPPVSGG